MIAFIKPYSHNTSAPDKFLGMLPAISAQAKLAFRGPSAEAKEEFVAEVVANAFSAYVRLIERGKEDVALPTPLAWYAIRQVRSGRRVGSKLNVHDITSRYAQIAKGIVVERLDQFDQQDGQWQEALVEDRHAGPADTAASRIDIARWLRMLPPRNRRIAKALAKGETTSGVAKQFNVTAGRVSQLRRELQASWQQFQGEPAAA